MVYTSLVSVAAVLTLVAAGPIPNSGFVALPVQRTSANSTSQKLSGPRGIKISEVPDPLKNLVYQYEADFQLGTGNQSIKSTIDTGSSDLWVYSKSSGAPDGFDPSSSTYVNNGFEISYVDGSGASGNYYKDKLTWGSATIDVQFAVAGQYSGNPSSGVFGIGFEGNEASRDGTYANYPQALKDQGVIKSVAYSLYLDDVNAVSGTLLFGAVDSSRYTGQLKKIPITSSSSFNVDFSVNGHQLNGVLDSGTSLTYLPDEVVSEIAQGLGATWNSQAQAYQAKGSIPDSGLTYTFSGLNVTVPKSELWLDLNGQGNGSFLTILPYSQSQKYILLGDTFLRSAYVVYDLESSTIAIAQANWNGGSSNYQVIDGDIPGAS